MIDFIDTWYLAILLLYLLLLIAIVLYILNVLNQRLDYMEQQLELIENKSKQKKIKKLKDRRIIFGNMVMLLSAIMLYCSGIKHDYCVKDNFLWEENVNVDINNMFEKWETTVVINAMEAKEAVPHAEWKEGVVDGGNGEVNADIIEIYRKKVESIYEVVPNQVNREHDENASELIDEKRGMFKKYVDMDKSLIPSEELWDAYQAGVEVLKVTYTDEVVFQMAVLAEAAHANAYKNAVISDNTSTYLVGAVEKFEEFLLFVDGDAGAGVQVNKDNISFRVGKMLHRESQGDNVEDTNERIHYALLAYSYFQYALGCVGKEDDEYLTYLYYYGEALINICPFIYDDAFCTRICNQYLNLWSDLDEEYLQQHNVEDKTPEDFKQLLAIIEGKMK